jgi:hypothetical protein
MPIIPTHTQSQTKTLLIDSADDCSAYPMVGLVLLFHHARILNAQLKRVNFRDESGGHKLGTVVALRGNLQEIFIVHTVICPLPNTYTP